MLVQEARDTNLRRILPGGYGTNQVTKNDDTRGSAVIWDKDVFELIESKLILGVRPGAVRMNTRYMSRATLRNKDTGRQTRVVSLHFPPRRPGGYTALQAPMASNVMAMFRVSRVPNFIIGGDFNYVMSQDKFHFRRKMGYVSRQNRIDGFYLPANLNPSAADMGPNVSSPHMPVTITVDM
jgi:hypothetical protein